MNEPVALSIHITELCLKQRHFKKKALKGFYDSDPIKII